MLHSGKTLTLKKYKKTSFEASITDVKPDPSLPLFPLLHKADSARQSGKEKPTALDYFRSGFIEPVPCDVFGENLVYTFIGRPSYRELSRPVCFVIRPAPELIQNVFLFDTGAYHENRYRKILDNELDINLFRIPADQDMIKRFITLNYGDNAYYYFSLAKDKNLYRLMDSVEEFGYSMLERIVEFKKVFFDTRCRTLENILRTPISLEKYLMAVILPHSLSENQLFLSFCKKAGSSFEIMYYDDSPGSADSVSNNRQIDHILLKYYLEKGYISI